MRSDRHLTWETFQQSFLAPGRRALHTVAGCPSVEIFVDDDARRIGVRSPDDQLTPHPPTEFEEIEVDAVVRDGISFLEVATREKGLFRIFYSLMTEFTDLVQLEALAPLQALTRAIDSFRHLLRVAEGLSHEEQIGLFGELWFVAKLLGRIGTPAIDAWLAPRDQPHDFRFGDIELEVKTTTLVQRVHVIHGEAQMEPSINRKLYVLSLQLAGVGSPGGMSLDDLVGALSYTLAGDPARRADFDAGLAGRRYVTSGRYPERYVLRNKPHLVYVDESFPRVTRAGLVRLLGEDLAVRVAQLNYRVNLEGLGVPEGSQEFDQVLARAG